MKTQILNKLDEIRKVAISTGMEGRLTLKFTGCTIQEWDATIENIIEYPRFRHNIAVTPNLSVTLLLG